MKRLFGYDTGDNAASAAAFFAIEFVVIAILLFLARKLAFSTLQRWASRTDTRADDFIIDSVRHPSIFWVLALSIYVTIGTSGLPSEYVNYGLKALYVLIILSVTLAAANIASRLAQSAIEKSAAGVAVTGLTRTVIKAVIFAIGFLIILNGMGISITPMLTALGVGGLAVALALQDSLSNLFAGMHILVEKPVKVGDYVKLSSGEEGFVADIGWRTTRLRHLSSNIIIVPNNKLSQSIITNYSMPDSATAVAIPVSVSYTADPDEVERVLSDEAAKAVGAVPGLLSEPAPSARFLPGFGASSLDFTLVCHVASYVDQYPVQHEMRKRIFRRFSAEGIEFPFPTRTVYIKK